MENQDNYVGKGWENNYGISLKMNLEKLKQLTPNQYGDIEVFVGKRKQGPDEKSKATHWVKESKPFKKEPF